MAWESSSIFTTIAVYASSSLAPGISMFFSSFGGDTATVEVSAKKSG
jgi:hypothetical protein